MIAEYYLYFKVSRVLCFSPSLLSQNDGPSVDLERADIPPGSKLSFDFPGITLFIMTFRYLDSVCACLSLK
jgi:hypothetical protein